MENHREPKATAPNSVITAPRAAYQRLSRITTDRGAEHQVQCAQRIEHAPHRTEDQRRHCEQADPEEYVDSAGGGVERVIRTNPRGERDQRGAGDSDEAQDPAKDFVVQRRREPRRKWTTSLSAMHARFTPEHHQGQERHDNAKRSRDNSKTEGNRQVAATADRRPPTACASRVGVTRPEAEATTSRKCASRPGRRRPDRR